MLSMELRQGQELAKKYQSNVGKDLINEHVKNVTLKAEREIKKAAKMTKTTPYTPTGRLAASISHVLSHFEAKVGTMVTYAPFVERGTFKMEARHMEGGSKIYGEGPFGYTERILEGMLPDEEKELVKNMEVAYSD